MNQLNLTDEEFIVVRIAIAKLLNTTDVEEVNLDALKTLIEKITAALKRATCKEPV